jgi:hypothetical protein
MEDCLEPNGTPPPIDCLSVRISIRRIHGGMLEIDRQRWWCVGGGLWRKINSENLLHRDCGEVVAVLDVAWVGMHRVTHWKSLVYLNLNHSCTIPQTLYHTPAAERQTLQQLPAGQPQAVKIAVQNNRRTRALSATAFYSRAALRADETARVKRGVARRTRPFDTKIFSRDRDSRREFSTRVQHWLHQPEVSTHPRTTAALAKTAPETALEMDPRATADAQVRRCAASYFGTRSKTCAIPNPTNNPSILIKGSRNGSIENSERLI